jgi:hypothetical protein
MCSTLLMQEASASSCRDCHVAISCESAQAISTKLDIISLRCSLSSAPLGIFGVAALNSSSATSNPTETGDPATFPEFPIIPGSLWRAQRWLGAPATGNLKLGRTKHPGTSHILFTVLQKRRQLKRHEMVLVCFVIVER